ncbi:hypothetical protein DB30_03296 [Enhygromyxa salina]|uniref:Uncharacterized protein n=1 Tax=Enhygromyxa salina TaxID=215803 RepID=A0A0C2DCD6_9BACT|nr:hypothetical protein DB30_03296 [Enhygromyxa salina]
MFFIADMLFRRSARNRKRAQEDAPIPRVRAKSGRSPRARLHQDALSVLV